MKQKPVSPFFHFGGRNLVTELREPKDFTHDPNSPCYDCKSSEWCPDAFERQSCDDQIPVTQEVKR